MTRDVDVTVTKPAGSASVFYELCFSGTATLDENGTQAAGEDYRVIDYTGVVLNSFGSGSRAGCVGSSGTVAFPMGTDSHTYKIRVFGDTDAEGDETVIVTLREGSPALPSGWQVSSAGNPATHTIEDDDTTWTVELTNSRYDNYEHEGIITVGVVLSAARSTDTAVEIEEASAGTATSGTDFTAGPWSITVPAGETEASVGIAITDDTELEMDETINIRIKESTLPDRVTAGVQKTTTVTVKDNEYTFCFDRDPYTVSEHAGNARLTLTMSRVIPDDVAVYFAYTDGTAVEGTDYDEVWASSSDTTTVLAWTRHLTLNIPIHPDPDSTATKRFTVAAHPSNLPDAHSACTATVDIASSGLVIAESGSPAGTTVMEDGSDTDSYTVRLETEPTHDVTVTVTAAAGAEVSKDGGTSWGATQTLTFSASGANIWSAAQTVTVRGEDDIIDNPGDKRTVTIAHAASSMDPGYTIAQAGEVEVTVTDDDTAPPTSRTDFIYLMGYGNQLERSEGAAGRAHFMVTRVKATTGEQIPNAWGFRMCFEGTATVDADYQVFNRFNRRLALDDSGCSSLNVASDGTGLDVGQDRAHFYIQVVDDAHEDSGEEIVVRLHSAAGTALYDFDSPFGPLDGERTISDAQRDACARGSSCPTDRLIFTILNHDGPPPPQGPYAELIAQMYEWREDPKWRTHKAHTDRWDRALLAFGERVEDASLKPMSAAQAQVLADRGWQRWVPVAKALHEIEAARLSPPGEALAAVLSAPAGDIAEAGGRKTFTLTLGRALDAGEALAIPLVFAGTATPGEDYTLTAPAAIPQGVRYGNLASTDLVSTDPAAPPFVTFTGPSAQSATLVLTVTADSVDEGTGETVTVETGTLAATGLDDGARGTGMAAFSITEPPIAVSVAATAASVTEGAEAAFTVTASRAPASDLTVSLAVSDAAGSDFLAADAEGPHTVTIAQGATEAAFAVATVDDAEDEPDGPVTVRVAKGSGYVVAAAPGDAASVEVGDDDDAAPVPALTVGDRTLNERDGLMWFTVRLSMPWDRRVSVDYETRESVPVSARANRDFLQLDFGSVTFRPGETSKRFFVYIFNDNHDEDPETFEVALSRPTGGAVIGDGVAVGTIVNDDPMPAAWLARFGRTVAEQALDGIAGRIAAPRAAGVEGAIAGQALSFDPGSGSPGSQSGTGGAANDNEPAGGLSGSGGFGGLGNGGPGVSAGRFGTAGFGHDAYGGGMQSQTMSGLEALLGSNFTATGETDGTGGSLAFWGRAAQSSFDGREGTFSLDGETTTAMLGADYARGKWLVGLSLMQSSGEGGYADAGTGSVRCPQDLDAEMREVLCGGAVRQGDGDVEASLTAAVPYAAIQASERLRLWGAAGYGTGEVTLKPDVGGSLKSDISWTMAAAGARSDLLVPPKEGSGPTLALTADGLWARTSSEKTHELAASDSDVTRLRVGLEGGYAIATEGGGRIVPRVEIGARHDGGDAETGFGVELGGGIAWSDPALGLSLDLSGRTLIAHGNDDLEDRGFAASMVFDPDPATQRGPSLSLRQEIGGQANGGLDALFATDPLADRSGSGEDASRWQAEAAYGLPAFSGRFTGSPHVGLGLATGTRDWTLGWRLTPEANDNAPEVSFGVKATRRESDTAPPEHTVGIEATARW